MKKVKVIQIGEQAISKEEPILVLFNNQATEEIKKFSIIHEEDDKSDTFNIEEGSQVIIDNQTYQVEKVGHMVNDSLASMGHATLVFKKIGEVDELPNMIYLSPNKLPIVTENTLIAFKAKG